MPFLTLSNADVLFAERKLTWWSYTPTEALSTAKRIQIIDWKEFTAAALDPTEEAFVVYVAYFEGKMLIHPAREAQIALLVAEKVAILAEYLEYANVFLKEFAAELPEHSDINEYAIDLESGKQPPYGPIYSLKPVELETLKTYIEINLANGFIHLSKSTARASILFIQRPDGSFRLFVDYRGLNNLTIKNRYPLSLIDELLKRLRQTKQFT